MVDGRGGAAVELRQVALERGLGGTGANELQVGGQGVVVLGAGVERLLGTGHGLVGQGHLAARRDGHALKLADGLAGGRDHAAHAVDLVAEELDTHRRRGLRRKDVHRVTVHVEAAGGVDLAIIGITHAHKKCRDLVEGHLIAHGKRARCPVTGACGRHAAQQRTCRRHDDAALSLGQARHGAATGSDHGILGRLLAPRVVAALGVAADDVLAEPRGERAGSAVGRLLARDHKQARARVVGPDGGQHKRTGGLRDGQGGVVARPKRANERLELRTGHDLARNAVDEHVMRLLGMQLSRGFLETPATTCGLSRHIVPAIRHRHRLRRRTTQCRQHLKVP